MIVHASGQPFRVQFVHSAHDLKQSRARTSPGGLRQIVDNLAASMRRRVSLAEISRVEMVDLGTGIPERSYVAVSQGFAICHFSDQFEKVQGRERSLLKALKLSGLSADVQDQICLAVTGFFLDELKAAYATHDRESRVQVLADATDGESACCGIDGGCSACGDDSFDSFA